MKYQIRFSEIAQIQMVRRDTVAIVHNLFSFQFNNKILSFLIKRI